MQGIIRDLWYAGLDKEAFEAIRPAWQRENYRNLKIYSALTFAIFAIVLIANVFTEDITSVNVWYYALMTVLSAVIHILAVTTVKKHSSLIIPLAYLLMAGLYGFAMGVTMLHRDMPAVIAVAMLFAVPFLFSDRPLRMICLTVVVVLALCVFSHWSKDPDVARLDMWNSLAVGFVTIPIELLQMQHKFFSFSQTQEIHYLSQTDILTGAKNRNFYEKTLLNYGRQCKKNAVAVFVDVNGLHALNDSQGHVAGDEMLKAVAAEMISVFGADSVYRIGGDEFIAFRRDAEEADARLDAQRIAAALAPRHYDISVGVASAGKDGLDMTELVKQAENEMYESKRAYYQQTGKERRRR